MQVNLSGRGAVITGASSGIGAATARVLAAAGAHVALVGRDEARLGAVRDQIAAAGGTATLVPADLSRPEDAEALADRALASVGTIHALVHNAGVYEPATIAETTLESFDRQWAIHVRSPFIVTQKLLPHLPDGAAIVFISSTVATSGFPGCSAYTATKGAVEAMARAMAAELAPRIRVNTVAPGFVMSPMVTTQIDANPEMEGFLVDKTPVGFVGEPDDIAHSIAFACSPLSRYMLGAKLVVDGGWTAHA
jgi:NAD(P)-dependent dehydrogenase (short-subunit alcohol dehydrogenase family)